MTMQHTPALEVATIPATYRAVVYTAPNGGEVRLTSYADAHLSDEDLIAAAMPPSTPRSPPTRRRAPSGSAE